MNQIKIINKSKIKTIDNKRYLLKNKKVNIDKIYEILKNRGFNNYIEPIEINDNYEIYPYLSELECTNYDRSIDIVYLLSLLHNRTTYYEKIDIDKIKERYESTIEELDKVYNYYLEIQDKTEEKIYMSPAELLLMDNISKIYFMINISRSKIEDYYKLSEKSHNERKVQLHGNVKLDHIIETDKKYLISWNHSKQDLPIYDLVNFYKNEFDRIDAESLFEIYQSKYKLTKEEELLFFSLINVPTIVYLGEDTFKDTINIRKLVDYIDTTIDFTLQEDEKNKKSD